MRSRSGSAGSGRRSNSRGLGLSVGASGVDLTIHTPSAGLQRGRPPHRPAQTHAQRAGSADATRGAVGQEQEQTHNMKVFVRVRPLTEGEAADSDNMRSLKLLPDGRSVYIRDRYVDEKVMEFNRVFGPDTHQKTVFEEVGLPACQASLEGRYGTVMAYGQTGTGKTYTAFGMQHGKEGLMYRCVRSIFASIADDRTHEWEVSVQYLQIYKEQVTDLLDEQGSVEIREDCEKGVYVKGATNVVASSADHALALFDRGNKSRVVRLTTMNAQSSRSHALFMMSLKCRSDAQYAPALCGRLTLVDLAGSERMKRTKATDNLRRQEAQAINMSLSCLGTVIHALTDSKSTHVPYRSCKLTRILRDSLGEHGQASIVVTISPALGDVAETLGSLYFGSRALCVRQTNKVHMLPDQGVPPAELHQRLSDLAAGKSSLEDKVAFLSADNTQLRDAAHADEYLIEELSTHLRKVAQRQGDAMNEEVLEHRKETERLQAKLDEQKKQMREREAAIEGVMEEELTKQKQDFTAELRRLRRERDDRIATLERENEALRERLTTLEKQSPPPAHPSTASAATTVASSCDDSDTPAIDLPSPSPKAPPMQSSSPSKPLQHRHAVQHDPSFPTLPATERRGSSSSAGAVGFESIERDMECLRRQHHTEVANLRGTLEEHRLKLEQAQEMLRRCSSSPVMSSSGRAPTPTPTPTPAPAPAPAPVRGASGERSSSSSASTVGYSSGLPSPPPVRTASPPQHVLESTLRDVQAQLHQERCSLESFREECSQLREETQRLRRANHDSERRMSSSLEAVRQENSRMRTEKNEERRLLRELIKERDSLKGQVSRASVSPDPSVSPCSSGGNLMRVPYGGLGQRGRSQESTDDREPIVGTFAAAVSPSSSPPSAMRSLSKSSPLPSFEHFFSSATLLQHA